MSNAGPSNPLQHMGLSTRFCFLPQILVCHALCMQEVNALTRLHVCARSSQPWLLADAIRTKIAQWLSGRVLDSRQGGRGFEPHWRHCVVSLSKTH